MSPSNFYGRYPRPELLRELNECLKTVNAEIARTASDDAIMPPGKFGIVIPEPQKFTTQRELLLAIQREAKKNDATQS